MVSVKFPKAGDITEHFGYELKWVVKLTLKMQNRFRFVLPIFFRATRCFLFPAIKSFFLIFRILLQTSKLSVLYLLYFISPEVLGAKLKQKIYFLLIKKTLCNETQQL